MPNKKKTEKQIYVVRASPEIQKTLLPFYMART